MVARRWSALVLLFALLGGGMGLPIADVVLYHSTPTSAPAHHTDQVAVGAPVAKVHLQSCVLLLSGLSGTSPVARSTEVAVSSTGTTTLRFTPPITVHTQTDIALGQSRAPPIA
jgi:hypothetical protein